jgi:hypothetical protein
MTPSAMWPPTPRHSANMIHSRIIIRPVVSHDAQDRHGLEVGEKGRG